VTIITNGNIIMINDDKNKIKYIGYNFIIVLSRKIKINITVEPLGIHECLLIRVILSCELLF